MTATGTTGTVVTNQCSHIMFHLTTIPLNDGNFGPNLVQISPVGEMIVTQVELYLLNSIENSMYADWDFIQETGYIGLCASIV